MSAGAMIGLAIILGAFIALLPGLVIWFAWLAVIFLFIGGNPCPIHAIIQL